MAPFIGRRASRAARLRQLQVLPNKRSVQPHWSPSGGGRVGASLLIGHESSAGHAPKAWPACLLLCCSGPSTAHQGYSTPWYPRVKYNAPPLKGGRGGGHCRSRASHRAHISPHPALASQSLSASQSSRLIRLAASMNAEFSAAYSSSCCLRASRLASCSRSRSSSHIGQRLSV